MKEKKEGNPRKKKKEGDPREDKIYLSGIFSDNNYEARIRRKRRPKTK